MKRDVSDRVGRWFAALRDDGESIDMRFGFIAHGASTPSWTFLPHDRFDGIGGFVHLLRKAGADVAPPVSRRRNPAPVLQSFRAFLQQKRRRPARWESLDERWQPRHRCCSRPEAVAWTTLSEEVTATAIGTAERHEVSLNSWLLWHLHQSIRDELDSDRGSAWMVPVNVRGAVRLARDTANHIGFLIVPVRDDDDVRRVHKRLRRDLRRGLDMGSWFAMAAGTSAGRPVLREAIAAAARRWRAVGTFSNLGAWRLPTTPGQGNWLVCPPVTRFQPLGVGALITNGCLALMMQAHPALTVDAAVVKRWLERLEQGVRGDSLPRYIRHVVVR